MQLWFVRVVRPRFRVVAALREHFVSAPNK